MSLGTSVYHSDYCYSVPPSPDLEQKIIKSKQRFLKGQPLPENITLDFLDLQTLILITHRPASSRAHTLGAQPPAMAPIVGEKRALVLLVDFEDNPASTSKSNYEKMLFSEGVYPTGSLRDYYREISYHKLTVTGDVCLGDNGWHRAPEPYSYYVNGEYGLGYYPRNATKLVEDVVDLAANYINFAKYDNDKDGIVDALFIVHAGPGAEVTGNTNHIWSHMAFIPSKSVDGVRISRYSMEPEDGKPGVFCHELAHVFGLPDLYDYDLDSAGTGKWDLMAAGSWNNDGYTPAHPVAWCKAKLGWMTPEVISEPQRKITLRPSNLFPDVYKLPVDNDSRQYFLIENRKRSGFDSYIPGEGLMILHVDESRSNNNDQSRYLVDIEQCDGKRDLNRNINRGDSSDTFPYNSNRAFAVDTEPNSCTYEGKDSRVSIKNIHLSEDLITAEVTAGKISFSNDSLFNNNRSSQMASRYRRWLADRFLYLRFV
jgi:immune inhibitor A